MSRNIEVSGEIRTGEAIKGAAIVFEDIDYLNFRARRDGPNSRN